MLEENVREWTREWLEQCRAQGIEQGVEQGRAQGIEQGRHEERALLCRLAARKFDVGAAEGLAAALADVTDPDRLARVGDWDHRVRHGVRVARAHPRRQRVGRLRPRWHGPSAARHRRRTRDHRAAARAAWPEEMSG